MSTNALRRTAPRHTAPRYSAIPFTGIDMAALVTGSDRTSTLERTTVTSVTTAMISNSTSGALHLVNASNPDGDWMVPPADYILPNMTVNVVATSNNQNRFPIVLTYRSDDGRVVVLSVDNSKTRADTSGTYASDGGDVSVTTTSGYPSMNVTYVLR